MKTIASLVIVLLLTGLVGCGQRIYVAPVELSIDPATVDESTLIAYRALVRDDFKAAGPPADYGKLGKYIQAATAVFVRSTQATLFVRGATAGDSTFFVATIDSFSYEARMSPNDSWFDRKYKGWVKEEILQHEQIHFALYEVETRKANANMGEIKARLRVTGATPEAAAAGARKRFKDEQDRVLRVATERSSQFDKDTVAGNRGKVNTKWWTLVTRELEETAPRP